MWKSATSVVLLSLVIVAAYAAPKQQNLPRWVGCTSHQDCAPGSCCTLGHERYSYPQCSPQPEEGDTCRPRGPRVTNATYSYPDGLEILIEDAYMMICPCSIGLACDRKEGVCRDANLLPDDRTD